MVIFGADVNAIRELAKLSKIEENVIVDKRTGVKSEMKDTRGMYVYSMTIRRKKKKNPDAMDIGIAERFEDKTKFTELNEDEDEAEQETGTWKPS